VGIERQTTRREVVLASGGIFARQNAGGWRPIIISVSVMFDRGAHSGKGLSDREQALFRSHQERARREYATSGIVFDLRYIEGAYLRTQGYSEIPEKFLTPKTINLFVTGSLGYDVDKDRTGGSSTGPHGAGPHGGGRDPFYKTFLGLTEAHDNTLVHEYAHHFTLDTQHNPTGAGILWADVRNDYWLWRQRHGVPIAAFRACAAAEWARLG
jgi:hypothetical protein